MARRDAVKKTPRHLSLLVDPVIRVGLTANLLLQSNT